MAKPIRRAKQLVGLLTLLCVLGGCGGHSTAKPPATTATTSTPGPHAVTLTPAQHTYELRMRRLGTQLGDFIAAVGTYDRAAMANATTEQSAVTLVTRKLRQLQLRLRAAAVQLASITPPRDVQAAHAQLREGVLAYAAELDGVIAAVRSGNLPALKRISALPGIAQMQRASTAITNKGYAIVDDS